MRARPVLWAIVAVIGVARAGPAPAQLCPSRPPMAACSAPAPERDVLFSGTVLQVIDGSSLCVAFGVTPDQWVRVRLDDAALHGPRGALMAAAFARHVDCVATGRDEDGVRAVCIYEGMSVARAAQTPAARAQAADWR